jgi:hypothetical protein
MIYSFRPFFVVVLVLLQFIAPLVHAHTNENFSAQGIHLPGLEGYGNSESIEALEPTVDALPCSVSSICGDNEGQVVGIDAGFSRDFAIHTQQLYKILADLDYDTYLASSPAVFKPCFSAFATPLHTSTLSLITQLANFAHPARAPPAHS